VGPSTPRVRRRSPRRHRPLALAAAVLLLVGVAVGGYLAARETALLALDRVEVQGATPGVAAEVRERLRPYVGRSLVQFDAREAAAKLSALSEIASARFDRAFPHTLKVRVRLERPVAVLRQGADGWLVSATARVLRRLHPPYPSLPRIWVPRSADVAVNSTLGGLGAQGVAALAPLRPLKIGAQVRQVRPSEAGLTLVLASGRELRLGNAGDLRLKLAIARQLLPLTGAARYVDVSVPERPVAGYDPQVEG
jgi:cell division protein FtsQ